MVKPDHALAARDAAFPRPRSCPLRPTSRPRSSTQAYAGASFLRCATHSATASIKRIHLLPRYSTGPAKSARSTAPAPWLSPIAVSTCDGSVAPLEQAEPLETANPFRSSAISSASLSIPSKRKIGSVRQFAARPRRSHAIPATRSRIPCSSRSRKGSSRAASSAPDSHNPLRRAPQSHGSRNVFRARAPVALMMPAVQHRRRARFPCGHTARPRPWARKTCAR